MTGQINTFSLFLKASPNTRSHIRWWPSVSPPLMPGRVGSSYREIACNLGKLRVTASGGSGQITFQASGQKGNSGRAILQLWALAAKYFVPILPTASCVSLSSLGIILAFHRDLKAFWLSNIIAALEQCHWNPAKPNVYRMRQHAVRLKVWHREREGVLMDGSHNLAFFCSLLWWKN